MTIIKRRNRVNQGGGVEKYMDYQEYLMHYGVLGMKWGQRRARKASVKASKLSAKGKTEKASKYSAKSSKIEKYHREMGGSKTYDRVKTTSTGKALAQSMLMGTYDALKYQKARASGTSRGKAAVNGYLHGLANTATSGYLSIVEPRANRSSNNTKKKK